MVRRPPAAPVEARGGASGPILAVAALAAFGVGAGVLAVAEEVAWQSARPGDGGAALLAFVAGGAALGFWYPRRYIRQRLAAGEGVDGAGRDPAWVGMLCSIVLFGMAAAWCVAGVSVVQAETWRAMLCARAALPAGLRDVLLPGPTLLTLGLAAGASAVAIQALHGWHRLARDPAGVTRFARWLIAGGLLAPLAARFAGGRVAQPLTAVGVMVLAAGAAALWARRARYPDAPAPSSAPVPRTLRPALAVCAIVAGLSAPLASGLSPAQSLSAWAAGGLIVAVALRFERVHRWITAWQAFLLPGAALIAVVGHWSGARGSALLSLLAVTAGLATIAAAVAGRAAARATASVQTGIAAVATASCGGLAAALLAGLLAARVFEFAMDGWRVAGLLIALLTVLGAAVAPSLAARGGLGLLALLAVIAPRPEAGPAIGAHAGVASDGGRLVATGAGLAEEFLRIGGNRVGWTRGDDAWRVDLDGPRWDVIIVHRATEALPADPAAVDRLAGRLARALVRGGCVLVGEPDRPEGARLAAAVAERVPGRGGALTPQRLTITRGEERFEALAVGRDLAARLESRPRPPGVGLRLEAVDDRVVDSPGGAERPPRP